MTRVIMEKIPLADVILVCSVSVVHVLLEVLRLAKRCFIIVIRTRIIP